MSLISALSVSGFGTCDTMSLSRRCGVTVPEISLSKMKSSRSAAGDPCRGVDGQSLHELCSTMGISAGLLHPETSSCWRGPKCCFTV